MKYEVEEHSGRRTHDKGYQILSNVLKIKKLPKDSKIYVIPELITDIKLNTFIYFSGHVFMIFRIILTRRKICRRSLTLVKTMKYQ